MTIFVTPDHNLDYVVSDVELIELDAEVNDLDIFADLSGDDYADAVLASLWLFLWVLRYDVHSQE